MAKNPKTTPQAETDGIRRFDPTEAQSKPAGSKELKGPGVTKWEPGIEITGMFRGLKSISTQFGAGELIEIEFAGSGRRVTFGAPAILANRVRDLALGVTVTIRCLGKKLNDSGFNVWQFEVFTPGADDNENIPF
jgi:hypothetical protein